jgi:hypothetical protein
LRNTKVNVFLLLLVAGNLIFALSYSIIDIFVYLIPTYLVLAIYLGEGLKTTFAFFKERRLRVPASILVLVPLVFFGRNIQYNAFQTDVKEDAEVMSLLRTMDRDAVLIVSDYHYGMMLYYYVLCERWNERNITIAYYHEEFPFRGIARYVLNNRPFRVTVTRTQVPPGLTPYFFTKPFKDYYNPPGTQESLRKTTDYTLNQLEFFGVKADSVQEHLYHLVPKEDQ